MPEPAVRKFVFVLGTFDLGGAERQALNFARFLTQNLQYKVTFLGFNGPGRAYEMCEQYGFNPRIIGNPLRGKGPVRLTSLLRFARILAREHPDVVLPYTMVPNVACGVTWWLSGAKLCIWNQRDEGRERQTPWLENSAVRHTPLFISNSLHGAEFLASTCGAAREHIHVVNNGVEVPLPSLDRNTWRRHAGIGEDTLAACMVANLSNFKDHITLLKAWRIVLDRLAPSGSDAVLLLAGRFDRMTTTLKALAFDLGLGRHVRFMGKVDDITSLLNACDLGVFSSQREGLPNGVLECMAAGLPVVGTDIPGIREALGPECDQLLAPCGDDTALAERIISLVNNPEERSRIGVANRQRVLEEFSLDKMCGDTVEIIKAGLL